MTFCKRYLSLLMAAIMLFVMIPATYVNAETEQTETGTIVIDGCNPVPGETITIEVSLKNNPGISSMRLQLIYDNSVFNLTGLEYNSAMGGETNPPEDLTGYQSPFVLYWNNGGLETDYAEDGVFATLTFQVSENAAKGYNYKITAVYDPDEIYNSQYENVSFEVEAGEIVIFDCIAGDIDGNGKVNMRDLTVLQRYYSGWLDITVNTPVMDVNGDGKKNSKDVTVLQRYFAGWDVKLNCACTMAVCAHSLTAVAAEDATCTEDGNTAYWYCADCDKYFSDAEAKTEIAYADTVIAATEHANLTEVAGKAATCTETGTVAHGYCADCDKYFSDAEAENEITGEDTVAPLAEHTVVTDPPVAPDYTSTGLTEGSHCGVCGEVLVAQEEVPMLESKYHSITYYNLAGYGVQSPDLISYVEHIGVAETQMPTVSCEGYRFLGWYTDEGKIVQGIPAGSTTDYVLYAKWEAIPYTITYRDTLWTNTTMEYTIESSFEIANPTWRGLQFSHWHDVSGKLTSFVDATNVTRLKLEKGTTGDIELVAKWKSLENLVIPKTEKQITGSAYLEEEGIYWFVYELGKIENVVLDEKYETHSHDGTYHKMTLSETVKIEETVAQTIANSISEFVSNSDEWSNTNNWGKELSEQAGIKIKTGIEAGVGKEGVAHAKLSIEEKVGIELGASESEGGATVEGGGSESGSETAKEVTNTFSFTREMSVTKDRTTELTADDPVGRYSYVNAADIVVYALIVYDPAVETLYLDTYSVMGDVYSKLLYERGGYVDYATDSLAFNITEEEILANINSAYYVKYDPNEGEGQMNIAVHTPGAAQTLSPCGFSKTGYTPTGWWLRDVEGNNVKRYLQGESVTDLTSAGKTVTLYADWTPNIYTVNYQGNGETDGSTAVSEHTYDIESQLSVNGFIRHYTVTYNYNGNGQENNTETVEYGFDGWTGPDGKVYKDQQTVLNLTSELQGEVTMYAKWKSSAVTLPSPTRTGYNFDGWYTNTTYVEEIGDGGNSYTPTDDVELFAKWTPILYTITYDANGGSIAPENTTHYYADTNSKLTTEECARSNYAFLGWSTEKNATEAMYKPGATVGSLSTSADVLDDQNVKLYAVWTLTGQTILINETIGVTDEDGVYEDVYFSLDWKKLNDAGYTKLKVEITFSGEDATWNGPFDGSDTWMIWVYTFGGSKLHSDEFEDMGGAAETLSTEFETTVATIMGSNGFRIEWGAEGTANDDWARIKVYVNVNAVKP